MITITDSDLLTRFARLPNPVKAEVVDFIDKRLDEEAAPKNRLEGGWAAKISY
jgi:hypothetical protein